MLQHFHLPWMLWGMFVFYSAIIPKSQAESFMLFPNADVVIHALLYFTWYLLLSIRFDSILRAYIIIAIPLLVGVGLEFLQHFYVAGRHGSWTDVLANSVGMIGAYFFFQKRIKPILNKV